jgi:hypothetical protein
MAKPGGWIQNRNKKKFWTYIRNELNAYPQPVFRIRDPVLFWPPDPGWKKSTSGIRDKHSGSYF